MKYRTDKRGISMAVVETMNSKAVTTRHLVLDNNIERLRQRIGNFIKKQIKTLKPDVGGLGWETSIGNFFIYKETDYDDLDIWKSKYKHIKLILEFAPKNGEITHRTLHTTKLINTEYEGLEECATCNTETILDDTIIRQGETLRVCKKCKDFDKLLEKLEKQIEVT